MSRIDEALRRAAAQATPSEEASSRATEPAPGRDVATLIDEPFPIEIARAPESARPVTDCRTAGDRACRSVIGVWYATLESPPADASKKTTSNSLSSESTPGLRRRS